MTVFVDAPDGQAVLLGRLNKLYGTVGGQHARTGLSRPGRLHRRLTSPQAGSKTDGPPPPAHLVSGTRPMLAVVLLAGLLGACRADRAATTGSTYPVDLRTRHPIVLADADRSLDIFPTGIGLSIRGSGRISRPSWSSIGATVAARLFRWCPRGGVAALAGPVERTGAAIRRLAAEEIGVRPAGARIGDYPVANPGLASPPAPELSTDAGKVADKCGLWPRDLGVSDLRADWSNEPNWKFGCATQANFAAQVADRSIWCAAAPRAGSIRSAARRISAGSGGQGSVNPMASGWADERQQCREGRLARKGMAPAAGAPSHRSVTFRRLHGPPKPENHRHAGHPDTQERIIAPVPRITIQAFCEAPETAAMIEGIAADRRMRKAHVKVQMGGGAAAVEAYGTRRRRTSS